MLYATRKFEDKTTSIKYKIPVLFERLGLERKWNSHPLILLY